MPEISERSFEEAIEREICGQKFVDTHGDQKFVDTHGYCWAGRSRRAGMDMSSRAIGTCPGFFPEGDPKKRSKDILDAIAKNERYAA